MGMNGLNVAITLVLGFLLLVHLIAKVGDALSGRAERRRLRRALEHAREDLEAAEAEMEELHQLHAKEHGAAVQLAEELRAECAMLRRQVEGARPTDPPAPGAA